MEILGNVVIAIVTFAFGLYAASYGARLGKSLDARKEILDEMRNWIDKIQDIVNMMHQDVKGQGISTLT